MGLTKLFDLIIHKRLILCRADLMTDRHELLFPLIAMQSRSEYRDSESYRSDCRALEKRCNELRNRTYLSCWSTQPVESFALWKIYLGGNNPGAAIRTSYKSLINSISSEDKIVGGMVKYTNDYHGAFTSDSGQIVDDQIVCFKYQAYSYENELRLFCVKDTSSSLSFSPDHSIDLGPFATISVDVDLDTLIQEIHLSPWCGGWFNRTFKEMIGKFAPQLVDRIKFSNIDDG